MKNLNYSFGIKGIKTKLILSFGLFVLMIITGVSFFIYNQSRQLLEDDIFTAAHEYAVHNAITVDNWMNDIIGDLEIMAKSEDVLSQSWSRQRSYLRNFAGEDKKLSTIFVADRNGNARMTHGNNANIRDREYFKEVMETGKSVFSEIIPSRADGEDVIVAAYPIYYGNNLIGLLGGTVDLHYLQGLVEEMRITGHGYGWILDKNMMTIAHPVEQYLGNRDVFRDGNEDLEKIGTKMAAGESDVSFYTFRNIRKGLAYAPVESTEWSVAVTAEVENLLAPLNSLLKETVFVGLAVFLMAVIVTYFIAYFISQPVIKISDISNSIGKGDLTIDSSLTETSRDDEIGVLARSINKMHKNLKIIIMQVIETSNNVAASSEELYASGEQVGEAAEEVGAAVEHIASGAEEQSAQVEESVSLITEMVNRISEVGENSAEMNRAADGVIERINKSYTAVDQSIKMVNVVKEDTSDVAEVIEDLGKTSEEIGNIVGMINSIASQTNLLALNAAIEAARAGKAGSGFSVVAEEIRVLAEDSAHSTEKIAELIEEIQNNVKLVNGKMDTNINSVDDSVSSIEKMSKEFVDVQSLTTDLKDIIRNVSKHAHEMAEGTDMVESTINSISTVSQEFAGNSQEVAASSEEQIAATEEIVDSAKQLADMSQNLIDAVNKFKV